MPRYRVRPASESDQDRWVEFEAAGGVWDEENATPPNEPCQFCGQTIPHRTSVFFSKIDGRLASFVCEEMAVN